MRIKLGGKLKSIVNQISLILRSAYFWQRLLVLIASLFLFAMLSRLSDGLSILFFFISLVSGVWLILSMFKKSSSQMIGTKSMKPFWIRMVAMVTLVPALVLVAPVLGVGVGLSINPYTAEEIAANEAREAAEKAEREAAEKAETEAADVDEKVNEPWTESDVQDALDSVKPPEQLIAYDLEGPEGAGNEESDGYTPSFETSSICNAVAELSQLTYQAGFRERNKQALPPELRDFEIRNGIKFSSNFKDDETLSFYLTLLAFDNAEDAENFASQLKEAVEPCGNVSGALETRTTIKFSELSGPNDFSHQAGYVLEILSVSISGLSLDYLVQKGSLVALVYVGSSEGGLDSSGLSADHIDNIAQDLIGQVIP
jgi:hypothetical protein